MTDPGTHHACLRRPPEVHSRRVHRHDRGGCLIVLIRFCHPLRFCDVSLSTITGSLSKRRILESRSDRPDGSIVYAICFQLLDKEHDRGVDCAATVGRSSMHTAAAKGHTRNFARLSRSLGHALLLVILCPFPGATQSVVNPRQVEFSPSADHTVVHTDGSPLVESYQLEFYLEDAPAPFSTAAIGKPVADPDGLIRVDLESSILGWPVAGTIYVADVAAVGPGGIGRSTLSNTFSFASGCNFSASPTSMTAVAAGATKSVDVTTATGCSWTAESHDTWVTITTGESGSGNGAVTYSVAANPSTSARTGTLTVAGQTVTVTQNGACSFSVTPTSVTAAAGVGTKSAGVTTAGGCAWTAASNALWLTITSGGSGSGNGTVTYSVAANPSTSARTGTLTVAGKTVTVTQSGACSFSVAPTSVTAAAGSGTKERRRDDGRRLRLDGGEQCIVAGNHQRRERQWQWHSYLLGSR